MKKYFGLSGVIISGLVHAAAEPNQPKKEINCEKLALFISAEMGKRYSEPQLEEIRHLAHDKGVLGVRYHKRLWFGLLESNLLVGYSCSQVSRSRDEEEAFNGAIQHAVVAGQWLEDLEHCVKRSPGQAHKGTVPGVMQDLRDRTKIERCRKEHAIAIDQEQVEKQE